MTLVRPNGNRLEPGKDGNYAEEASTLGLGVRPKPYVDFRDAATDKFVTFYFDHDERDLEGELLLTVYRGPAGELVVFND